MKVLFFSKAMTLAAYGGRIDALARHVDLDLVVPERWGSGPVERAAEREQATRLPVLLHGHNHLHVYRGAAEILERHRPSLVHIDEEPYSLVTLQLTRLCRRHRVPCVFFAWQNLDKRLPPPFGWVRSRVFNGATGGIAGTPAAARVLRAAGFDAPLAIIPQMGVDPHLFRPDGAARASVRERAGCATDEILVGFGGRLVAGKGVDLLLRAAASLPRVRVLILGDGPERPRLQALAAALDLRGRVRFQGRVESTEMPRWLSGLDVLALPSRTTRTWSEQFGRILVEAMACGVAVVASRSGEIPHVLGRAGVLVPEGDVLALAARLQILGADRELRSRLGRAGRRRVLDRFTHAAVAHATAAFYETLVAPEMHVSRAARA